MLALEDFWQFSGEEVMAEEQKPTDTEIILNSVKTETPFTSKDGNKVSSEESQTIGLVFEGKYLIEEKIGEGGMGVVYRATHILMERPVAIKFLHSDRLSNNTAIERFKKEAKAAGRIQHPNATAVLDFGVSNNTFYLVMEYLEGRSLRARLREEKHIPDKEVVRIVSQTCEALDAAHKCNIVHRDLKPDNIFLQNKDGVETVKVLDFGIAKIIQVENQAELSELTSDNFMGTPFYMSPEQFQSDPLSPATDIYTIGIITYELLTGQRPFHGDTIFTIGLKHMGEPPPSVRELRPDLPPAVDDVIKRALAKKPPKRQQSTLQFAEEFRAAMVNSVNEPVVAQNPALTCSNSACSDPKPGGNNRCLNCNSLLLGTLVRHRYEIQKTLSKSTLSITYLVKDHDCFEEVRILKELSSLEHNTEEISSTTERRFKREAMVLLNLQHPGIPKLYAYFTDDNNSYLVQDYVPGVTLFEEIKNRKRLLNESEAITLLGEIAEILDYLHTRTPPLIHRDIKPHNLMRQPNGRLQLVDFSAVCQAVRASSSTSKTLIGSPGYAPPEQLYGHPVPQSDLYAMGATIIHLLTGTAPNHLFNFKTAQLEWDTRVKLSPEFNALLRDLVVPFVEKRLSTVSELQNRLATLGQPNKSPSALGTSSPGTKIPPVTMPAPKAQPPASAPIPVAPAQPRPAVQKPAPQPRPSQQHPVLNQAGNRPQRPPQLQQPQPTTPPVAKGVSGSFDFQSVATFCYEVETILGTLESATYYALLGVERNSSAERIRIAYEEMARRFHPDKHIQLANYNINLRNELERIFQKLNEAYRTLSDARLRSEYDRSWRGTGLHRIPNT